jgi:DNA-binding CsgD family transcriptional regulator
VGLLERRGMLGQLDDMLGQASGGRGRLVLVRGEAGIGKTALVESFVSGHGGRVWWGACDPVTPPRPLAPITDIAVQAGGELLEALADPGRHRIIAAFLALLRRDGGPWVAVVEDAQWADEATLELLGILGRRISQLPAVAVVTVRDDDLEPGNALSAALGDIPVSSMVTIRPAPLSQQAVTELARGTGIDPVALHRATGGNPFFVTEVLAGGGPQIPPTVRDAVWARAQRLAPGPLRVVKAAAVAGPCLEEHLLAAVAEATRQDVEECVRRGLLRREGSSVEFRHQLALGAVAESLTAAERADLHGRALAVLRSEDRPDLAALARHAAEAANAGAVLDYAPRAAAHASRLGAHRAAAAHYGSALPYAGRLAITDRASLLASYAHECHLIGEEADAVEAQRFALELWQRTADVSAPGRAMSRLAEYLWWAGAGEQAERAAADAVELLDPAEPDLGVTWAYARLAQVSMMLGKYAIGAEWGDQAIAAAEALGDEEVAVHALNTVGVCRLCAGDDEGWALLDESLRRALAADLEEGVSRALNNLVAACRANRRYHLLGRYTHQADTFFGDRDLDGGALCLVGDVTEGLMDLGRWADAESRATEVVGRGQRSGRVQALAVLGRLAARRGDPDPCRFLDEAMELQRGYGGEAVYPLRPARAEAAWLAGDHQRAAREIEAGLAAVTERTNPWLAGEIAFWAGKAGVEWDCPRPPAEPHALYLDGHPAKAAAAWEALGCPYEQAMCLLDTGDEDHLKASLAIFQSLGARPAANLAAAKLREMGARRISRGPRPATAASPAGLSAREVDVLRLIAGGLRNADIAERLVLSPRTVNHHVSAVLAKLGVTSRHDVAGAAARLGIDLHQPNAR